TPTPTPGATPGPTPTATPAITTPATATPAGPAPSRSPGTTSSAAAAPTLAQLIGQKLMVKMSGTTPSASLLARARAGQIGGVILFGANISSPSQVKSLTATLQAAAAA